MAGTTSSGGGGGGIGFDVARTGVASVGFVGFPSVGKSTLLSKLTGTESEAAEYEFTTLVTVPGVIRYRVPRFRCLICPVLSRVQEKVKVSGQQVIAVARTCTLLFIVLDVNKPLKHKQIIEKELEGVGIRLNKSPPDIIVKKKEKGGISITSTVPLTHFWTMMKFSSHE